MFEGESIEKQWNPPKVELSPGRSLTGDFVGTPVCCAETGLNEKAMKVLEETITQSGGELLPIKVKKFKFWCLYSPKYWDSLRTYVRKDDSGRDVEVDVNYDHSLEFDPEKIPPVPIFRVKNGRFAYFCTDEFKRIVEANHLRGLEFRKVWTDGVGEETQSNLTEAEVTNNSEPMAELRKLTKRDRVLLAIWDDVINVSNQPDWIQETIDGAKKDSGGPHAFVSDAGRVITRLKAMGVSDDEIRTLVRSLAYLFAFQTLTVLDEFGVAKSPSLKMLHEDLLIANPGS